MKCICDKSELFLKTRENFYGHWCDICHGVFLNSKKVDYFKYNFETDLLDKAFECSESKSTDYECCNCNGLMVKVNMDIMHVIICQNCKSAFFNQGELTRLNKRFDEASDIDGSLIGCLPPSIVAIFALFKYLTVSPDSRDKSAYGWLFIAAVLIIILFWSDIPSYQCGD